MNGKLISLCCAAAMFCAPAVSAQSKTPEKKPSPAELLNEVVKTGDKFFNGNLNERYGSYHSDGIEKALALYASAFARPEFGNTEKVELCKRMADCRLELNDIPGALAELDRALKLENLSVSDRGRALFNKAAVLRRAQRPADGLKLLNELESKYADAFKGSGNLRNDFPWLKLACQSEADSPEALAAHMKALSEDQNIGLGDRFIMLQRFGGDALARDFAIRILEDPKRDINDKNYVLNHQTSSDMDRGNYTAALALADRFLPGLRQLSPDRFTAFYRGMLGGDFNRCNVGSSGKVYFELLKRAHAEVPNDLEVTKRLFHAYVKNAELSPARQLAPVLLASGKLQPDERMNLELVNAVLNGKNAKLKLARLGVAGFDALPAPERAAKMLVTARAAMDLKFFDTARSIYAERNALVKQPAKPSVHCTFVENSPKTTTAFLASGYFQNPANRAVLNRKYGSNLNTLLETDSALTGRKVTAGGAAAPEPTVFSVLCDVEGVHLFFQMPCSDRARMARIRDGFDAIGGFEMYLTTGFYSPYNCFLIDFPPNENFASFETQYPNAHHRGISPANKNLRISSEMTDGAMLAMISIDWSALAPDSIPVDGTVWEFEPLHWENGGWSWGGSESVHNRSSFGHLVFANLTPENRTKIMRRLLVKAKNVWDHENSTLGGLVEHWRDPELGDVEFYRRTVRPFKEKFDAYAAAIKPDMTDAEVNRVFDEAYAVLNNANFVMQEMRTKYLEAKHTSALPSSPK